MAPSATPPPDAGQTAEPTAVATSGSNTPTSTPSGDTSLTPTLIIPPTATLVPPTATSVPATPLPGITLQILSSTNYMDANRDFHVIGEIKNTGSQNLSQVQLTLVIKDTSGNSLLKDNNSVVVPTLNFSPMLTNLAPGETSPFGFTLYAGSGTPDPNTISVVPSSQNISTATLAGVEIQHAQMVANSQGSFLISGIVVNKGSKPVLIRDIAATLLNSDKKMLAAAYSVDYTVFLQPAGDANKLDTSPFYLRIDDPASAPTDFKIYLDAEVTTQAAQSALKLAITNHYFEGPSVTGGPSSYHIVGTLTNNGSGPLSTRLVAGLFDKNNAVLDTYSTGSPVNVAAHEVIPFDISSFENVNNSVDIANTLDHLTVQIDSYYTYTPVVDSVTLTSTIDSTTKTTKNWTVTGKVTNNSNNSLSIETVLVGIYDSNSVLMAVNYGWILPSSDSIDKGSVNTYTVVIPIAPGANVTNYTVKILVKGEIK